MVTLSPKASGKKIKGLFTKKSSKAAKNQPETKPDPEAAAPPAEDAEDTREEVAAPKAEEAEPVAEPASEESTKDEAPSDEEKVEDAPAAREAAEDVAAVEETEDGAVSPWSACADVDMCTLEGLGASATAATAAATASMASISEKVRNTFPTKKEADEVPADEAAADKEAEQQEE